MRGIRRSPVNSPHKGRWRGALIFSLICPWINGWVNNREAGDLRLYRAHYDVIVMQSSGLLHWQRNNPDGFGGNKLGQTTTNHWKKSVNCVNIPSNLMCLRFWNRKNTCKISRRDVMPSFVWSYCDCMEQLFVWLFFFQLRLNNSMSGSFSPSVRLPVCLSVCPWHVLHYVPVIVSSQIFRSYFHWQKWCPCIRSRSEVKCQGHRGQNPV